MKKITVLIVGAAGYVAGARAGRERYEQIKQRSAKVWGSPTVQHAATHVDRDHQQPSTIAPGVGTA